MKTGKTVCDKRERIQNIYRLKMMKKKHINRKMNIRKRTVGAAVSVLSALALTFATPMSVLAEPTDDATIEQQKKEQEQKEKV